MGMAMPMNAELNIGLVVMLGMIAVLSIVAALILAKKEKGRVANIFLGMVAGGAIVAIIFMALNSNKMNSQFNNMFDNSDKLTSLFKVPEQTK